MKQQLIPLLDPRGAVPEHLGNLSLDPLSREPLLGEAPSGRGLRTRLKVHLLDVLSTNIWIRPY